MIRAGVCYTHLLHGSPSEKKSDSKSCGLLVLESCRPVIIQVVKLPESQPVNSFGGGSNPDVITMIGTSQTVHFLFFLEQEGSRIIPEYCCLESMCVYNIGRKTSIYLHPNCQKLERNAGRHGG